MSVAPDDRQVRHGGRRRAVLMASVTVLVLVAALVAVLAAARTTTNEATVSSPEVGRPAPAIEGKGLGTGRAVSLAGLRGRYVLVNFFASWCPPCRQEAPALHAFSAEHARAGDATVLGVVFDDTDASAEAFLRETGATWPAVGDPGGRIAISFGVAEPPESFLVSPAGVVLAKIVGPVRLTGPGCLDCLIREATASASR